MEKSKIEMTVAGFIAYLSKFDQEAPIVFIGKDSDKYSPSRVAVEFTERVVNEGHGTVVIVGLA